MVSDNMTHIFVNTQLDLPIGKIVVGEIFPKGSGEPVVQAIRAIRIATIEEYVAWVNEANLGHLINRSILQMKFFYVEVLD